MRIKTILKNTLLTLTGATMMGAAVNAQTTTVHAQNYAGKQDSIRDWQLPNQVLVTGATYATSPIITLAPGVEQSINITPASNLPTTVQAYGYNAFVKDEAGRIRHYSKDPTLQSRLDRDRVALNEFKKLSNDPTIYKIGNEQWDHMFLDSLQKFSADGNFSGAENYKLSQMVSEKGLKEVLAGVQVSHPAGTINVDGKNVNVPAENTPIGLRIPALMIQPITTPESTTAPKDDSLKPCTENNTNVFVYVSVNPEASKASLEQTVKRGSRLFLGGGYEFNKDLSMPFVTLGLDNGDYTFEGFAGYKSGLNRIITNPDNTQERYGAVTLIGFEAGKYIGSAKKFKLGAGLEGLFLKDNINEAGFKTEITNKIIYNNFVVLESANTTTTTNTVSTTTSTSSTTTNTDGSTTTTTTTTEQNNYNGNCNGGNTGVIVYYNSGDKVHINNHQTGNIGCGDNGNNHGDHNGNNDHNGNCDNNDGSTTTTTTTTTTGGSSTTTTTGETTTTTTTTTDSETTYNYSTIQTTTTERTEKTVPTNRNWRENSSIYNLRISGTYFPGKKHNFALKGSLSVPISKNYFKGISVAGVGGSIGAVLYF